MLRCGYARVLSGSCWRPSPGRTALLRACYSQEARRWDITPERWVDIKYSTEDLQRFPLERAAFRKEPRLRTESLSHAPPASSMDWGMVLRGAISSTRLGDCYTGPFQELVLDRLADAPELMELFQVPLVEDAPVVQAMHSKAVPGEGAYRRVRMQTYWLALHVWLLHTKQHSVQEGEWFFGSALCALLTRRLFEFQWNRIRGILHAADVPIMSVSNELQDLQEYVFGFCVALDDAFKEEVASAAGVDIVGAIAAEDADLQPDRHGLAPRLKYILWANMYSGAVPHDATELYELTVYLLRQRIFLDAVSRDDFLSCRFSWASHPPP